MKKLFITLCLVGSLFGLRAQILSPVLNDASLLAKRDFQITLGYSALGSAYDGESQGYLNSLDLQIGYGISSRFNLIARYEKAWLAKQFLKESAGNFLSVGPEIQLMENHISLYLPIGTTFYKGDSESNFEFTPTINFSIPLSKRVSFNPSVELGFQFCENCSDKPFLGVNLGLGVRAAEWLTFFGEYDLLYSFEDFGNGHVYMVNGGVAFRMPAGAKADQ